MRAPCGCRGDYFKGYSTDRQPPSGAWRRSDLQRTRFELIVERKLRRRQLTDDGNVEITGRDLRERTPPVGQGNLFDNAA